jgi:hypothetical protein
VSGALDAMALDVLRVRDATRFTATHDAVAPGTTLHAIDVTLAAFERAVLPRRDLPTRGAGADALLLPHLAVLDARFTTLHAGLRERCRGDGRKCNRKCEDGLFHGVTPCA